MHFLFCLGFVVADNVAALTCTNGRSRNDKIWIMQTYTATRAKYHSHIAYGNFIRCSSFISPNGTYISIRNARICLRVQRLHWQMVWSFLGMVSISSQCRLCVWRTVEMECSNLSIQKLNIVNINGLADRLRKCVLDWKICRWILIIQICLWGLLCHHHHRRRHHYAFASSDPRFLLSSGLSIFYVSLSFRVITFCPVFVFASSSLCGFPNAIHP